MEIEAKFLASQKVVVVRERAAVHTGEAMETLACHKENAMVPWVAHIATRIVVEVWAGVAHIAKGMGPWTFDNAIAERPQLHLVIHIAKLTEFWVGHTGACVVAWVLGEARKATEVVVVVVAILSLARTASHREDVKEALASQRRPSVRPFEECHLVIVIVVAVVVDVGADVIFHFALFHLLVEVHYVPSLCLFVVVVVVMTVPFDYLMASLTWTCPVRFVMLHPYFDFGN